MGVRPRGGRDDVIVRGGGDAIADVVAHASPKEPGLLQDHTEGRAERPARELAQVHAVEENPPLVHIVEPEQQIDEGRLAAARGSDEGEAPARGDVQVDVFEELLVLVVGEPHMLDIEPSLRLRKIERLGCVRGLLGCVEQCEEPARRGECRLDLRHYGGDLVEGPHVLVRV